MCRAAELTKNDTVVEVGPGLGTLTAKLAKYAGRVVAVEFDGQLADSLATRVQAPHLEVVAGDVLAFNPSTLQTDYKVVANVPYYITSKIIRHFLEAAHPPEMIVLLVQKEVAERLAAGPGDMSLLAVSAQFYAAVDLGPIVPASLFTPPPKVDSQIVRLRYHGPVFADVQPEQFFRVVRAGFAERRKKLRSSLSGGLHLSKAQTDQLLAEAQMSQEARAQELTLEEWRSLTQQYFQSALH